MGKQNNSIGMHALRLPPTEISVREKDENIINWDY